MDIQRFRHFSKTRFHLEEQAQRLSDGRVHPKIGVRSIFQALFYLGVFGLGSLLGLDQFLRTSKGKKLFGGSKPLVSDSTLSRSLRGFGLAGLQALLETVYATERRIGESRCDVAHDRLRIGVLDGSCFGHFRASCFAQIGSVCLMGGLEPIPKPGQELPASTRLVRRGKGGSARLLGENQPRVQENTQKRRQGEFLDLAVWGIQPEDTLRAIGAVLDLDAEIEINLVDVSTSAPSLLNTIEREGIDL